LPGRPYLPGWTLWGALTVFLKRSGRWSGDWGELGSQLNEKCWLGHFCLIANGGDGEYGFLPSRQADGAIRYCWQKKKTGQSAAVNQPDMHPMAFRHGVTRLSSGSADNLGRLFLHEIVRFDPNRPFRLQGLLYWQAGKNTKFPLVKGDILKIGGNRQVSGAEISCERIASWKPGSRLARHHLLCLEGDRSHPSGNLERIVLRRTRAADGKKNGSFKGFGQHFVDWGDHLAPGWQLDELPCLEPVYSDDDGYRHGTVRLKGG